MRAILCCLLFAICFNVIGQRVDTIYSNRDVTIKTYDSSGNLMQTDFFSREGFERRLEVERENAMGLAVDCNYLTRSVDDFTGKKTWITNWIPLDAKGKFLSTQKVAFSRIELPETRDEFTGEVTEGEILHQLLFQLSVNGYLKVEMSDELMIKLVDGTIVKLYPIYEASSDSRYVSGIGATYSLIASYSLDRIAPGDLAALQRTRVDKIRVQTTSGNIDLSPNYNMNFFNYYSCVLLQD